MSTHRDISGQTYGNTGTASGPAPSGAAVTIFTPTGPVAGHMVGNNVVADK